MHKVELLTNFGPIALDGARVGLKEWPEFFDGFGFSNTWDSEAGAFRELVPNDTMNGELNLVVKGRTVGQDVSELLDAIRWEQGAFTIQVTSCGGVRHLPVRLSEVGQITWHPHPQCANLAEVPLRVEWGEAAWLGAEVKRVFTRPNGWVKIPYAGDVDVWPKIQAGGNTTIKLRDTDTNLFTPSGASVVYTDPRERGVTNPYGAPVVGSVVPFWANPPQRFPGYIRMYLAGNYQVTVTMTEKWSKAWA